MSAEEATRSDIKRMWTLERGPGGRPAHWLRSEGSPTVRDSRRGQRSIMLKGNDQAGYVFNVYPGGRGPTVWIHHAKGRMPAGRIDNRRAVPFETLQKAKRKAEEVMFDLLQGDASPARVAKKWKNLPPGWTDKSVKKFWKTLGEGTPKHKVWNCIEKMEGHIPNTGAFCGGLADWQDPGWRKKDKEESPGARSDAKSYWKKKIKNKKAHRGLDAVPSQVGKVAQRVASRFMEANDKSAVTKGEIPFYRGGGGPLRSGPAYFISSEMMAGFYGPVTEYRLKLRRPKFVSKSEWGGFDAISLRFDPSPVEDLLAEGYDSAVWATDTPKGRMYTVYAVNGKAVSR